MAGALDIRDLGWRAGWRTPNRAFTRTDLCAVTAIVGIIAMLLVLRLSKAGNSPSPVQSPKPNAQRVQRLQCLANIKQLAAAELMYAADHAERFCPSYLDYNSVTLKSVWMGALADYHGRPDGVWLCASTTNSPAHAYRGTADAPWTFRDQESDIATPGTYAINGYLGLGQNYKQGKAGTLKVRNVFHEKLAVQQPARTRVFCDAIYWNCRLEETDAPPRNLYEPEGIAVTPRGPKQVHTQFIARHGNFPASEAPREVTSEFLPGAINAGFVDGHAETVSLENLWTLYWHKNWDSTKVPLPHPPPK